MKEDFINKLYSAHQQIAKCPTQSDVAKFFSSLMGTLFPEFAKKSFDSVEKLDFHILNLKEELYEMLYLKPNREGLNAENNTNLFFDGIPAVYQMLQKDIDAMFEGDPAAKSRSEVIRSYPGFYATAAYRFANLLHSLDVKLIPRLMTEHSHNRTGIDIHPGASIGESFCIDHGTGLVIGATTNIGNNVKIYQGVTLGALSVRKEDAETKRHPTIEDGVVIYSGATILGGKTIVGKDSIIGGNVWITKSVPPESKVYYQSSQQFV